MPKKANCKLLIDQAYLMVCSAVVTLNCHDTMYDITGAIAKMKIPLSRALGMLKNSERL